IELFERFGMQNQIQLQSQFLTPTTTLTPPVSPLSYYEPADFAISTEIPADWSTIPQFTQSIIPDRDY
ncbi:16659_t:CDS:1, partial [Funneliformis mosseae]